MGLGTHNLAEISLKKPDGSGLTRIEAEQALRDGCKIVHNMRLLANYHFGLESRYAYGMMPSSIIHWILDEMIRKRLIAGEQIGVQPELETDSSYYRTYTQKLFAFAQSGQALQPKEGEGINMGEFGQMPPGSQPPPNGQPNGQFMPPPPPPMGYPGQQQAGPPPQQNFQQPPPPQAYGAPQQQQFQQPPQAPQNMPGYAPPQHQQQPQFGAPPGAPGFGPPPGAPSFPPQQAPGAPPPQMPGMPQQAAPGAPPQAPPATAPANRRPRKQETAPAGAPPQQMGFPAPGGQPGFGAPPGAPGFGPPNGAGQQAPQGGGSNEVLQAQINELKGIVASQAQQISEILRLVKGIDAASSIMVRPYYEKPLPQQPQQLGVEATFKEIGLPYPS